MIPNINVFITYIGNIGKTDGAWKVNAWSVGVEQTVCKEQTDRLFFYLVF